MSIPIEQLHNCQEVKAVFSQKTIDFLVENRLRNDKEWYSEHKNEYNEYVLQPLKELCIALSPNISSIDDFIVTEPKVDKTISRIYRDTRFSNNKLLYRDEMWLSFKRDKQYYPHYPEFYIVATPKTLFYGCGYYATLPETMNSIRKLILDNDPVFLKALQAYEKLNTFHIDGEKYKKSHYPEQSDKIRDWLDRKNISFTKTCSDFSILFSEELPQIIAEDFRQTESIYNFFLYAESKRSE